MTAKLEISAGQFSDRGERPCNEDFYGILTPTEPLLSTKGVAAAIADGISASSAAALAAEYAVKNFLNDYFSTPESWTVKKSGEKVLSALNRWLYGQGENYQDPSHVFITTLSALVVKSSTVHVFHVGDTRIHQLRDGTMDLLTRDHRVWTARKMNYLNRAMGTDLALEIDYRSLPAEIGDIYVFTSDGVHEYLSESEMVRLILENPHNLDRAAAQIVAAARTNGSPDNLTCQLLRIDALPQQDIDTVYQKLTELPFPPELEAGMVLDGFLILREIHASSTSQLYLAVDQNNGEQVVVKTPSINYSDDPAYLERFCHEEWIGRRIDSPYVLKVRETSRRRRFLYHAVEYIEGQTLRQWLRDNPQPPLDTVRRLIEQIAQGLRAFHRLEMLHRDLKPENILIDRFGTAKIIDFGSVKIAGIHELASPIERSELLGTKNYTAPEYLLGESGSNRSDLFSLGVIAYEMLTGHLPYGEALGRRLKSQRLCKQMYISACRYRFDIPLWIDGALAKAVRLDPERRYPALSEFLYDLYHPNPEFSDNHQKPLIERNPLRFWQVLCTLLLISNVLLLWWLKK